MSHGAKSLGIESTPLMAHCLMVAANSTTNDGACDVVARKSSMGLGVVSVPTPGSPAYLHDKSVPPDRPTARPPIRPRMIRALTLPTSNTHSQRWQLSGRRALVAGVVILAACYLALLIPFRSWRRGVYRELQSHTTVIKTAMGNIEYSIVGQGPPVLYLHSGYSGADRPLSITGYRVVTPSRMGYLRTPLTVTASLEDQARALAVLLDSLGIGETAVVTGSAGGPSALEFAARYPDRVSALILIAAITKTRRRPVPQPSLFRTITDVVFGADFTDWVLVQAVRWTPYADERERQANPDRRTLPMRLGDIRGNWITSITSGPWSKRHPGFAFDRMQAALLGERDPLPITAPTLVIHGTADGVVDFSHAESAARRITGARLVAVDEAGHGFAPPHRTTVDSLLADFLLEHAPTAASP